MVLEQDVYTIPGFDKVFNGASMMKLHNLAVEQGAMQQLLLWLSLLEIISGVPALIQVPSRLLLSSLRIPAPSRSQDALINPPGRRR